MDEESWSSNLISGSNPLGWLLVVSPLTPTVDGRTELSHSGVPKVCALPNKHIWTEEHNRNNDKSLLVNFCKWKDRKEIKTGRNFGDQICTLPNKLGFITRILISNSPCDKILLKEISLLCKGNSTIIEKNKTKRKKKSLCK